MVNDVNREGEQKYITHTDTETSTCCCCCCCCGSRQCGTAPTQEAEEGDRGWTNQNKKRINMKSANKQKRDVQRTGGGFAHPREREVFRAGIVYMMVLDKANAGWGI